MAARKKGPLQLLRAAIEQHLLPEIEAAGYAPRKDLEHEAGWNGHGYNWLYGRPDGLCLWLRTNSTRDPEIELLCAYVAEGDADWRRRLQEDALSRVFAIPIDAAERFDPLRWPSGAWFWRLPTVLRASIWAITLPIVLLLSLLSIPFLVLRKPYHKRADVKSGARQEAMAKEAARRFAKLTLPL